MNPFTAAETRRLAKSREFAKILAEDPELARLERLKFNHADEVMLLAEVLQWPIAIGPVPVRAITPALWSLLWAVGSPYVCDGKELSSIDADVFLYLLAQRKPDCSLTDLPGKASGMAARNGLDVNHVHAELCAMIRTAFRALQMLPPDGAPRDGEMRFDADWLTRLVGVAARESNERASYCMYEMSLSAACCHYVNYRRRETVGAEHIYRRADGELAKLIMERTFALGREFLDTEKKDVK